MAIVTRRQSIFIRSHDGELVFHMSVSFVSEATLHTFLWYVMGEIDITPTAYFICWWCAWSVFATVCAIVSVLFVFFFYLESYTGHDDTNLGISIWLIDIWAGTEFSKALRGLSVSLYPANLTSLTRSLF